jgi:perosamine synthetase
MTQTVPLTIPFLDNREIKSVAQVIKSGWLTQGPAVEIFEQKACEIFANSHAVAVSNCTSALFLSLTALGVLAGDEVITVSHSFIATANAITMTGAKPVFVDVEHQSHNIDPGLLRSKITPRTKAIVCVHQFGMPCDLQAIFEICEEYGLKLVEDAACAAGSMIQINGKWAPIGSSHADAICFSFHPRKVITTGEGGLVMTQSKEIADKIRILRQHGMTVSDRVRHNSNKVVFEQYDIATGNYRMTDLQAAIGCVQLEKLGGIVSKRRKLANFYNDTLSNQRGLVLPKEVPWAKTNWQSYVVKLTDGVDQLDFTQKLLESGISTRRGGMCAHLEKPYVGCGSENLLNSELLTNTSVCLPLYPHMTRQTQSLVCKNIIKTLNCIIK